MNNNDILLLFIIIAIIAIIIIIVNKCVSVCKCNKWYCVTTLCGNYFAITFPPQ